MNLGALILTLPIKLLESRDISGNNTWIYVSYIELYVTPIGFFLGASASSREAPRALYMCPTDPIWASAA